MEELEEIVLEEWVKLELEKDHVITNLLKSFPRRLKAVIEAKIWNALYRLYSLSVMFPLFYLQEQRSRRKNGFKKFFWGPLPSCSTLLPPQTNGASIGYNPTKNDPDRQ
jgi:hypothetical protein